MARLLVHPDQLVNSKETIAEDIANLHTTQQVLGCSSLALLADTVVYREYATTEASGSSTEWEDARQLLDKLPREARLYIRRPYRVKLYKVGACAYLRCASPTFAPR